MGNRFVERAGQLTWAGLILAALGPSIMLVTTWAHYVQHRSAGLWGGYGIEPWTSVGIIVGLGGAVVSQLAASARVLVRGDWLRRILVILLALAPGAWWATAVGFYPFPRFAGPDPVGFAFTLPLGAALMLLAPSVAAAVLAFLPIRQDARVTFAPVPRRTNRDQP
ncbi:MAG TPA: hypothetical protein VFH63_10910 [candidate division Zixibacteria bacterium]|nr:hypothetical protein [candidate division Zixibacteria bacterium]